MPSLAPAEITLRTPVKATAGVRADVLFAKNTPACRSRTTPALPRKPRPLSRRIATRACAGAKQNARRWYGDLPAAVFTRLQCCLPGTCRAPCYRLLIGVPRQGTSGRVAPAGFEPAFTAPEAAVAVFQITAVDLGCLDYRQPVKRRSFRVSSGSC